MEELFNDIEGCDVIVDNLIVWGRNDEEHDQRLINVLDRAREAQLNNVEHGKQLPYTRSGRLVKKADRLNL